VAIVSRWRSINLLLFVVLQVSCLCQITLLRGTTRCSTWSPRFTTYARTSQRSAATPTRWLSWGTATRRRYSTSCSYHLSPKVRPVSLPRIRHWRRLCAIIGHQCPACLSSLLHPFQVLCGNFMVRVVARNFTWEDPIWGGRTNEATSWSREIFFYIFAVKWCILVQKQLTLYIIIGFRKVTVKRLTLRLIKCFS